MLSASKEFENALQDLNSYVAKPRAEQEALQWQSAAASKYRELFEGWLLDYNDIVRAMDTMIEVLTGNAKAYADNEEWALQAVNGISREGGRVGYTDNQKTLMGM
jgi:uncharacterized protein YukE